MIKKLLIISAFFAAFSVNAQSNLIAEPAILNGKPSVIESPSAPSALNYNAKSSAITLGDTLWYFFNKTFYKNPGGSYYTFNLVKTYTVITHVASRFQNVGNLAVNGLEAIISRGVTTSTAATARLILCNVVSGQPVLPGLDSVSIVITATNTSGYTYGANFGSTKFVSGDYAVVMRNASVSNTDTLKIWMTNGLTTTFGEGMGHMRIVGSFTNTTGVFTSPVGNDFEMLVAPRVGFTGSAGAGVPSASVLCTTIPYTFNNTSSYHIGHRQYNLNEFYRRWRPFTNTITAIPADSVFTWTFGDATGNFYTTTGMPSINHTYSSAGTFNGSLIARYQKQADSGVKLADAANFAKTVAICGGVQSVSGLEAINVYPNPSTGLVNISNLPYESTIDVVNMLGQLVHSSKANQGNYTADLSTLPNGSYFVKISVPNEKTKIVKLILN